MRFNYNRPELAQYQKDIIDCEKRFTITEASTKSGKTVSHIVWLFEQAFNPKAKRGHEFWWVAPIFSQAQIAFERMQRFVNKHDFFITNKSQLSLTLPNGAVMRFKSADNPNSLYGEDVQAAVFDEFTRAKYDAYVALRSTLTATKGKCKYIGNYRGDFNWGHILSEKAKDLNGEYKYFKITAFQAAAAGILDYAEIEQARKDLNPENFNMLYLAEGNDIEKMLFSTEGIRNIFENTHVLSDASKRFITADIATEGSDKFVIGVWHGWTLIKVISIDKSKAKEVNDKLIETKNKYGVPNTNIIFDSDGVGALVGGYIPNSIPFHNGGSVILTKELKTINGKKQHEKENFKSLKHQCYFKLRDIINEFGMNILEDCRDFEIQIKEELGAICKDDSIQKTGVLCIESKATIKEKLGRSPDFADMLMMRVYFDLVQRKGFSMS